MKKNRKKRARQQRISELVNEMSVKNQAHLIDLLKAEGFEATQATVSRDIKELNLVKITSGTRNFKYVKSIKVNNYDPAQVNKHIKILKETILEIHVVRNLIVLKCTAGGAGALCMAIDFLKDNEMLGTIAGDDTALVIFEDDESALQFESSLHEMLEF